MFEIITEKMQAMLSVKGRTEKKLPMEKRE